MRMRCPHCKSFSRATTSREVSSITRESFFACTNTECGHTFVAYTEIHHTLSPAARPDPNVRLPLSAAIKRRRLIEQLNTLPNAVRPAIVDPQPPDAPAAIEPRASP